MKKISFERLFDNSLFVKIISFIIAVLVWVSITMTTNPNQEKTINNIPVNIPVSDFAAGKSGLEAVTGSNQSVSVTVSGKRYKVGNLTGSDIKITADVSKIQAAGTYDLKLTAAQVKEDSDYTVKSITPSSVRVRFDYVVTAEIPLEAQAPNITAKDSFIKGNPFANVETIKIQGAQSDVEKVKRAVLITDKKANVGKTFMTDSAKVVLYDKDDAEVSQEAVTYTPGDLQLTVPIMQQKTINLTFGYKNVPDGFPIDELKYTMSKSTLKVMAASEAIANVKELNIGYIDLRTVDIGSSFVLDIGLPSGFENRDDTKKVTVRFEKADLTSRTFSVSDIRVINKPNDYDMNVVTKQLPNVKIIGKKSILAELKPDDIRAVIDMQSGAQVTEPGEISAAVKITVPGKGLVWAVGEHSAVISALKK